MTLRFRPFFLLRFISILAFFTGVALSGNTAKSVFSEFITRDGDRLMQGDSEFRFAGVNMPGITVPYDYTLLLPERLVLPTHWEQENGFKTLRLMHAQALRLWNLPMRGPEDDWMDWAYIQGPGKFNEESFKVIDQALAFANQYGIRVIFPFTAEAGDYLGGIGTYADWRGKERQAFFTDPELKADFKATIAYVLNRRNTVTGQLYREDKAILAWELGNELRRAPLSWEVEMADFIKSIDPNHLVMAGNDSRIPEHPPASLDIFNKHYYGGDWEERCREDRALARGKRPLIIGEYGGQEIVDADFLKRFLEEALENGTSGHLLWSMAQHHRFGGFYWHQIFTLDDLTSLHWPGPESNAPSNERDVLSLIRDYAFRMAGLPVALVPVPEVPAILPVSDLPLLSWRGSPGASGYQIERAMSENGPWTIIAEDVSDGNVAYRPLWNDATAEVGPAYYYRISARNESGLSAASEPVGPIRYRAQVLVDELSDLRVCSRHSDSVELHNERAGLYAEYLYRASGGAEDFIAYQVPGKATHLRFWAFHEGPPGQVFEPRIELRASGGAVYPILVEIADAHTLRVHPKVTEFAGQQRTLVRYEAALPVTAEPSAENEIVLTWTGPTELDRVEIEYQPDN
jgi:hypothetical protein